MDKFRVWDEKREKWVEDFVLSPTGEVLCTSLLKYEGVHETTVNTVRYTGFKDKEGVEIYAGDILSGDFDFPDAVFFDNERGQWMLRNRENFDDTLWQILRVNNPEIIGNTYENPELLEVGIGG